MLPVIALVGRPNVGKSTLYNRLTKTRDAIVADFAGLTRDRHYGEGKVGPRPYIVVDTGGFEPTRPEGIVSRMASQAELAIDEADAVIFVVDARAGVTPQDHRIADSLRKTGRRVYLAVNKAEGLSPTAAAEFYELGIGDPYMVSAAHGQGIMGLVEDVLEPFPADEEEQPEETPSEEEGEHRIRVAIAGRPNVGKSTLVNALLGEERVVAFDMPGTTRDAINIDFEYDGHPFTLVDTAGLRKKGRVFQAIEKFSVVKTLQAIADSNVVVLVIDAQAGVAEHDAHIAAYALDSGRALVVAVNKWDGMDAYTRTQVDQQLDMKLRFLHWAKFVHISALKKNGLNHLMKAVKDAYAASIVKLPTPKLTRALIEAVNRQQPPRAGRVRPKMRYAHQGGSNPPVIVIHGNSLQAIGDSYRRYLESWFRDQFGLAGTPLKIEFKVNFNPYAETRPADKKKAEKK